MIGHTVDSVPDPDRARPAPSTRDRAHAAVWSGTDERFRLDTFDLPDLAEGEVLVEIDLATICGSDLHTVNGDRATPLPTVLGHEAIGTVVDTGGSVTDYRESPIRIGDRITWTIGTSCGDCARCVRGLRQKCLRVRKYGHEAMTEHWHLNGGLATHCHLLAGTGIVRLPDGLPATVATPANCATATVVNAARRVHLGAGDAVIVLGCGMLGLTAVAYARDLGVERVVACDVDPARLETAAAFGATHVCTPPDLPAAAREYGADVILEMSGSNRAVHSALDVVDVGGRIGLVGSVSPADDVRFEPSSYVTRLVTMVGSHNYQVDDLSEAVAFLERTAAQGIFAELVSAPYQLREIERAVDAATRGDAPRVAVRMR